MLSFTYITQLRDSKNTSSNGVAFTNYFFTSTALVFYIHLFKMDNWYWDDDYPDFVVLFKRVSLLFMDKMNR